MGNQENAVLDNHHYLKNQWKIQQLVKSANISSGDHVMELGAGIGSIARGIPRVRKLTLVDTDSLMCGMLRQAFSLNSWVHIRQADGLAVLEEQEDAASIVFANLPFTLTDALMEVLTCFPPKLTLLSMREGTDLSPWESVFAMEVLMTLDDKDFFPTQPFNSIIVRLTPLA